MTVPRLGAVDWVVSLPKILPSACSEQVRRTCWSGGDYGVEQVVRRADRQGFGGGTGVGLVENSSTTAIVEKIRQ